MKTKLSSKGQVVLPKAARQALAWPPGTRLQVTVHEGEVTLRPESAIADDPMALDRLAGCLARPGQAPRTLDEQHAAVAEEARRQGKAPQNDP
ncbi:MAG: AbrB/MazE/SpoVT family DNA-binding domain-containing protein [Opitutales bacterium]